MNQMKISDNLTEHISKMIAGDIGSAPNLSGYKLVEFYNECGFNDTYGPEFPTRWRYSKDKIDSSNGTLQLKTILEKFVDPRRYFGDEKIVEAIVTEINQLIKYEGYNLIKIGAFFKVANIERDFIKSDIISSLDHDFVSEQIGKCHQKITIGDYNGAITNSRTLCEAVLIHIIESIEKIDVKNDGDLIKLWSRAKKALKLNIRKEEFPEFVYQILSGLESIINGLAGISNNAGDRHANKFNTKKHHAKIAVNSAMTFCDFLIEILNNKELKNRQ